MHVGGVGPRVGHSLPTRRLTASRWWAVVVALVLAFLAGGTLLVGCASQGADDDVAAESARPSTNSPTESTTTTTDLPPPSEPPPVYILVLDEFSLIDLVHDGALNATRYPRFAELAGTSTWYTNWTIHSGRTIHSVPAMLSGVLPRNALATPEEYPSNIFDLLSAQGWDVNGLEHNSWLCRPEICTDRLPYPQVEPRSAQDVYDAFEAEIRNGGWPHQSLHVAHLLFPHTPWQWLPDGTPYGAGDPANLGSRWAPTPWLAPVASRTEYLWQSGHTDTVVGRWMDAIVAKGEWDDALVIVTFDHGIDLQPGHNTRDIRDDNQNELVWVPMFVKWPGQDAGHVVDEPHSASELLAIVASATGVTLPDGVGLHHRVVVTDEWPYEVGAELNTGPVDETARPRVTGEVRPGPGWEGLATDAMRQALEPEVFRVLGQPLGTLANASAGLDTAAGVAYVDAFDDVVGSSRGSCGWDVAISGHLDGPPHPTDPYVALAVDGVVVGVAPVDAPWPRAAAHITERPSFFHVLVEPDDVDTIPSVDLVRLNSTGQLTGRYDLQSTSGREPRCTPS